ncbi:MAG: serine/threonine protein kinase [Gammaproteobacteria bacterium]|jgi:serine/threonine protein kinase
MDSIDTDNVTLILSGVKILQHLDIEVVRDIASRIQIAQFETDQIIVKHGNIGTRLYIIFNGKVEVRLPGIDGHVQKQIALKKGAVVGEISLLTNASYSADILALANTTALYLDRRHFDYLVEKHKAFAEIMTNLMTDRMAQNGGINRVGKYELTGKLGEGNMSTVFNGYDKELDREVAIKMLKYELAYDPQFVNRFEQEARIIASMHHPNIVNVIEVIEEFSTRFIVMEKLVGQNLSEVLKDQGAFGITETRDIIAQVGAALQYAHNQGERGIVHRDIKPSNIVIDLHGNIKLTDFGISGPPEDQTENIEGTPSYLAPEIIKGDSVDGRADIYALGIMAFHMLTNTLPFTSSSLNKLLDMQVNQPPPDIRNSFEDLDEALAEFINRSMIKNPKKRISDWNEIKTLLRPVTNQSSIPLDPNELAVVIRFRNTSYQRSAKIIHAIQKLLQDEDINHSIEMQRGEFED